MDEFTNTSTSTSSKSGIGFAIAAVLAVLVLLYVLFAGGSVSPTGDPAAVGATDGAAPVLEETVPAEPAAPALDN